MSAPEAEYGMGWVPPSDKISARLACYADAVRRDETHKTPETWAAVKREIVNLCDEIHRFARSWAPGSPEESERLLRSERFESIVHYVECLEAWSDSTDDVGMGTLRAYGWDGSMSSASFLQKMRDRAFPPADHTSVPLVKCLTCRGSGHVTVLHTDGPGFHDERCPECASLPLCPACVRQTASGGSEPAAMSGLRPAVPGEACSAPDCVARDDDSTPL